MKDLYKMGIILAIIVLFLCGIEGMKDLLTEHMLTDDERGMAVLKCSLGYAMAGYLFGILVCDRSKT